MKRTHVRGLFVTGTDTGVGKSIVTGGLGAVLREKGINVAVMKPVETGCLQDDGSFFPADAQFLKEMSGADLPLEVIVPFQFKEPLAPSVAAEREGVIIDCNYLVNKYEQIASHHDFVLVESAGGIAVPLYQKFLFLNLIKRFKLPILIVSRSTLGTINHTLLTVRAAQEQKIHVAGIVINNLSPERSVASETISEVIAYLAEVPIWGVLPYQADLKPQFFYRETIMSLIRTHLNLEHLYKMM